MSDARDPKLLILEKVVRLARPNPADDEWVSIMKEAAKILGWPVCPTCNGFPPNSFPRNCCNHCYNVCFVDPEDR